MKYLAMTWADRSRDELNVIDFVFHISLKKVQKNQNIEQIIIDQHPGLKDKDVQPSEIKWILQRCTKKKTVVLLDGHDEYSPGTNFDIDNMITKRYLRNCGIILTSREKEPLRQVREYMDTEIEIMGFDEQGIHEYATKLLKKPEKCKKLMVAAEQCKLKDNAADYGILHIPIFLQMVCFLFEKGASVLTGKVAVLSAIIERCVNFESFPKNWHNTNGHGKNRACQT